VPLVQVQQQLRHSSIITTRREYVDVHRELKEQTASAMDRLLANKPTKR
jgi:integrase